MQSNCPVACKVKNRVQHSNGITYNKYLYICVYAREVGDRMFPDILFYVIQSVKPFN